MYKIMDLPTELIYNIVANNPFNEVVEFILTTYRNPSWSYIMSLRYPEIKWNKISLKDAKIADTFLKNMSYHNAAPVFQRKIKPVIKYIINNDLIDPELISYYVAQYDLDLLDTMLEKYPEYKYIMLYGAINGNNVDVIKRLRDVPNNIKERKGLVSAAVMIGNLESLKALDYNLKDHALIDAARYGRLNIVKYLVDHGTEPDIMDNEPIYQAAFNGNLDIVKYLLGFQEVMEILDMDVLLDAAIERNHLDIIKYIINNFDVDIDEAFNNAVESTNVNIAKYIYKFNPNLEHGYYLFHAIENKDIPMLNFLSTLPIKISYDDAVVSDVLRGDNIDLANALKPLIEF